MFAKCAEKKARAVASKTTLKQTILKESSSPATSARILSGHKRVIEDTTGSATMNGSNPVSKLIFSEPDMPSDSTQP